MIDVTQRRAADAWFLDHGLPAVLRPGALVRRLWPRSAPALAGFAVMMANSALVVALTGKHTIDIDGHPTRTEWFVLGLLIFVLPIAAVVGWLVSRISTRARPDRRGDGRGDHRDRGWHPRRPQPPGTGGPHHRRRRLRRDLRVDRMRRRLDHELGRSDDDVEPCRGGIVGDPRPPAAVADVSGLLQFARLADGGHDLAFAPVAGPDVPRRDRCGVRA